MNPGKKINETPISTNNICHFSYRETYERYLLFMAGPGQKSKMLSKKVTKAK
jgi:hypothetical protein